MVGGATRACCQCQFLAVEAVEAAQVKVPAGLVVSSLLAWFYLRLLIANVQIKTTPTTKVMAPRALRAFVALSHAPPGGCVDIVPASTWATAFRMAKVLQ